MNTLLTINLDSNEALIRLTSRLAKRGFQVTRSFDLQSARAELRVPEECSCPNHGTANCNCQYVVLLVDREGTAPVTLVIHGHDNETMISLDPAQLDRLDGELEAALRLTVQSLIESTL